MKLEGDERKRAGAWELACDLMQSTGVRKQPEEVKAPPPEPTIMETVYQVLSSVGSGK